MGLLKQISSATERKEWSAISYYDTEIFVPEPTILEMAFILGIGVLYPPAFPIRYLFMATGTGDTGGHGRIYRAPIVDAVNLGPIEEIYVSTGGDIKNMCWEPEFNKLYWTEYAIQAPIMKMNADGSSQVIVYSPALGWETTWGVWVDALANGGTGWVWFGITNNGISRVELDGSNYGTFHTLIAYDILGDRANEMLYYTERGKHLRKVDYFNIQESIAFNRIGAQENIGIDLTNQMFYVHSSPNYIQKYTVPGVDQGGLDHGGVNDGIIFDATLNVVWAAETGTPKIRTIDPNVSVSTLVTVDGGGIPADIQYLEIGRA